MPSLISFVANIVILILILPALWIIFGATWKTRKSFNLYHKFLLLSVISLGLSTLLKIFNEVRFDPMQFIPYQLWIAEVLDVTFVIFLILGIFSLWKRQNIGRRVDEEIK